MVVEIYAKALPTLFVREIVHLEVDADLLRSLDEAAAPMFGSSVYYAVDNE